MKEIDDFKDPCEVVAKILFLMGGETLEDTDTELRKFKCAHYAGVEPASEWLH